MFVAFEKTAETLLGTPVVDQTMGPVAPSRSAVRSNDVSPQIP